MRHTIGVLLDVSHLSMIIDKNIKILEFGAGLGTWISAIQKKNFKKIFAVEISKKRRDFLKKLATKVIKHYIFWFDT